MNVLSAPELFSIVALSFVKRQNFVVGFGSSANYLRESGIEERVMFQSVFVSSYLPCSQFIKLFGFI